MQDRQHYFRRVRLWALAALVVGAVVVGSMLLRPAVRGGPVAELTDQERSALAAVLAREVPGPIASLTRNPDGTVSAFIGSSDQLGGQIVVLRSDNEGWRVVERTLLF